MLSREENRRRRITRQALRDWYGSEFTKSEMAAYPGDGEKLSSYLDGIMSKTASPDILSLMELKEKWQGLAGAQIAQVSKPLSIKENVLWLEVTHNIWIRELTGPAKPLLIKNINKIFGEDFCKDIRCIAPGGSGEPDKFRRKSRKKE